MSFTSSAPLTVGLLGHNGLVGSKLLAELTALHQANQITLVVVHRASSDLSTIADGIDKREIDLTAEDGPDHDAALKHINLLVAAISTAALNLQLNLLPALSRSETLQLFIPSHYGHYWSDQELGTMSCPFIRDKVSIETKIREAGIPTATIWAGLFSDFCFKFTIGQWNPKGNQVFVCGNSQDGKVPLTTTAYFAKVIAQLVTQPLYYLVDRHFVVIEYEPTNAEITEILTRLHGDTTELVTYNADEVDHNCLAADPMVSLGGAVLRKAAMGWWHFPGAERVDLNGWETEGVEAQLRKQIEG